MIVNTMLYFPEHIANIREFQEIAKCYDLSLQPLWDNVMKMLYDNQWIDTLDEYGCKMYEDLLNITANPIDELEDRRRRIKGYCASNLPYTEKKMNEVLSAMCGEDGYVLAIDKKLKTVTVNIKLNSVNLVNNAYELMKRMIPADMFLTVEIIYNIYARFRSVTNEAMSQYTHEELRTCKIFQQSYNMHCNLGRYTYEQLSAYTHTELFLNASLSGGNK